MRTALAHVLLTCAAAFGLQMAMFYQSGIWIWKCYKSHPNEWPLMSAVVFLVLLVVYFIHFVKAADLANSCAQHQTDDPKPSSLLPLLLWASAAAVTHLPLLQRMWDFKMACVNLLLLLGLIQIYLEQPSSSSSLHSAAMSDLNNSCGVMGGGGEFSRQGDRWVCHLCRATATTRVLIRAHMADDCDVKKNMTVCGKCGNDFPTYQDMCRHRGNCGNSRRLPPQVFKCQWCTKDVRTAAGKTTHENFCLLSGLTITPSDGPSVRVVAQLLILEQKGQYGDLRRAFPDLDNYWQPHFPPTSGLTSRERYLLTTELLEERQRYPSDTLEAAQIRGTALKEEWLEKRGAHLLANPAESVALRAKFQELTEARQVSRSLDPHRHRGAIKLEDWDDTTTEGRYHDAGDATCECSKCGALLFAAERQAAGHGPCCHGKSIGIPPITYLNNNHKTLLQTSAVLQNIVRVNGFFQMSVSRHSPHNLFGNLTSGIHNVILKGKGIKKLVAISNDPTIRQQLWIMGGAGNANDQMANMTDTAKVPGLEEQYQSLRDLLIQHNEYAKLIKSAVQEAGNAPPGEPITVAINVDEMRGEVKKGDEFDNPQAEGEMRAIYKVPSTGEDNRENRVLWMLDGTEKIIDDLHPLWEPCQFPLLFPNGGPRTGWRYVVPEMDFVDDATSEANNLYKGVSALQYGAYHMYDRSEGRLSPALHSGKLSEMYFLMLAIRSMTQRITFHKFTSMRYSTREQLQNNSPSTRDTNTTTARTPLPSSFSRGERARTQSLNDALALRARFGPPDYFITMTANPKWKEIQRGLLPGERPSQRSDLIHRVFNIKMEYVTDLLQKGLLGDYQAHVRVVEYQKRGLPHLHLLLYVQDECKPQSPSVLDMTCCAELPDPDAQPELFRLIDEFNVHTACDKVQNARCKIVGADGRARCKSHYPKPFLAESICQTHQSYSRPKRPNNGRQTTVPAADAQKVRDATGNPFAVHMNVRSNQYVVPYNPFLSATICAHVNVEVVGSPAVIKYLFKYLFKPEEVAKVGVKNTTTTSPAAAAGAAAGETGRGQQQAAAAETNVRNEPQEHLLGMYIGAAEAMGYLLGTQMISIKPAIVRLAVHLENQERIYYCEGGENEALARGTTTTLTGWFEANAREQQGDSEYLGLHSLSYLEMPEYCTWVKGEAVWRLRRGWKWDAAEGKFEATDRARESRKRPLAIGRMMFTPPKDAELQCLRMLVMSRAGATSFEDLRTVNGEVYNTFKDAAGAHGLLEDGALVERTIKEAADITISSKCLRFTFCVLLDSFVVSSDTALRIWNAYKVQFCMPYRPRLERSANITDADENAALQDMSNLLRNLNGSSTSAYGLPEPSSSISAAGGASSWVIRDELAYDMEAEKGRSEQSYSNMNPGQKAAFDAITEAVIAGQGGVFFLQGAAGTGKTFTYDALLSWCRGNQMPRQDHSIALAVASSGIAATLLCGGRTAHNRFKIPLNIDPSDCTKVCSLPTEFEDLIRKTTLIVWDEVVMARRECIEIVDRSCKRVRQNEAPFGGIVTVLGGDIKQILPVHETKEGAIAATLHMSPLWPEIQKISLTQIMRQQGDLEYAQFLSAVGDGSMNEEDGTINLFSKMYVKKLSSSAAAAASSRRRSESYYYSQEDLIEHTFPNLSKEQNDPHSGTPSSHIGNAMIMCPTNNAQRELNQKCLQRMPGEEFLIIGQDTCIEENVRPDLLDNDVLNQVVVTGIPLHTLRLKVGAPVMLLKNLNPPGGLCNGTRLILKRITPLNLLCVPIDKPDTLESDYICIPRVKNEPDAKKVGFAMKRVQFPVSLAFASTINKAQGQTLDRVGLDLTTNQCFAHGQLYVALSRCRSSDVVKVAVPVSKMTGKMFPIQNPVFKEVLDVVGRDVEGIFANLTDAEKAAIRTKYQMISDAAYSTSVHQNSNLPPPTAEALQRNAPLPNTVAHLEFAEDGDDDDDDDECMPFHQYQHSLSNRDADRLSFLPPNLKRTAEQLERTTVSLRVRQFLTAAGLPCTTVVDVPGDGHCFYHSLLCNDQIRRRVPGVAPAGLYQRASAKLLREHVWKDPFPEGLIHLVSSAAFVHWQSLGLEHQKGVQDYCNLHRDMNSPFWADSSAVYLTAVVLQICIVVTLIEDADTGQGQKVSEHKYNTPKAADTFHVICDNSRHFLQFSAYGSSKVQQSLTTTVIHDGRPQNQNP